MAGVVPVAFGWALGASGCSSISDCGDDPAACAKLLNENPEACAEAFTLKMSDRKRKACRHAMDLVGDEEVEAAVPGLSAIVQIPVSGVPDDRHKAEAAKALGEIGSKAAVEPLMNALDLSVGTSNDPEDKMGNRANEEIAKALGEIGDPRAVPKLLEVIDESRNDHVILEAVRALGDIGPEAKAGVEKLTEIALEDDNKFMRKNAVIALGDIGDPAAVDALIQMMFIEFQGVSFYKEASYALFKIGEPAVEPLLETLAMKNEDVDAIFEKSGGAKASAVIAKTAVVLGDLRAEEALDPLIAAYEKGVEENDPVIIREVAFALGSLGDEKAVPVLMKNMDTLVPSLRERIMGSLNKIGDRRPVPKMIRAITARHFIRKCVKQGAGRQACKSDLRARAAAQKAAADKTTHLVDAEHVDDLREVFEAEEQEELKTYFMERFEAAKLAAECAEDVGCWAKHAKSDNPLVREKTYWELGRIQGEEAEKILAEGLSDRKRKPRAAAIFSYWKFGDADVVPAIEKQLEEEKGSADFMVVNEDLKRLLIDLKRSSPGAE